MQGINILKRLAKLLKRAGRFLALPILIILVTTLLISPSRLVELTTNVADMNGLFRWLLVAVLYGLVVGVLYLEGHLPIIDRIIRFRAKRKVTQAEKLATKQGIQSPSGIESVTKESNPPSATEEKKPEGLLGGVIKTGVGRVIEEVKNRTAPADDKLDSKALASESPKIDEAPTANTLSADEIPETPKVDASSDNSDMSEDDFYSFLGTIQTSESDEEASDST